MLLPYLQEPITREGAREAAENELRKPVYRVGEKSPIEKAIDWVMDKIGDLFSEAVRVTPGGVPSLILLVFAIVAIAIAVRLGLGPTGLREALTDRRRGAVARTSEEYRAEAERFAAEGDFKEAVRARFRAIIRGLEERAVLDPRPGRTAGEIAREGGSALPAIGEDLRAVAKTFDEVWYGRRAAVAADYALVREADDRVRNARLATAAR